MRILQKEPEFTEAFVFNVDYPKESGLTFSEFHPVLKEAKPLQQASPTQASHVRKPHWQLVADKIHDLHTSFASHNAAAHNPRCSAPDRTAVLTIYREALNRLEHASFIDAHKINLETITKVHTILDLRVAEPNDAVFYTRDAFLSPLEPQYARPRLDFYNREPEQEDDRLFWTGYRRLTEWRREGWPAVVPKHAIERERKERRERSKRKGRLLLRATAGEGLLSAFEADAAAWGEEVDADPGRPWA